MREVNGNIWDLFNRQERSAIAIIPICRTLKKNGCLVMGRGLAAQAKQRYPGVDKTLGRNIVPGSEVFYWPAPKVDSYIGFAVTKNDWWQRSSRDLVSLALRRIRRIARDVVTRTTFVPRLGCGLGGLRWHQDVKPLYISYFAGMNNIIVVHNPKRIRDKEE